MDLVQKSEEGSVIIRDVILLALTGFIFMVVLLLPFVNPPTEIKEISATKIRKGELL